MSGYNPFAYRPKGEAGDMLRKIFQYRDATTEAERSRLSLKYGFRYSEIMRLTTFEPAVSTVIEPMHNSYLGIVKDFTSILFNAEVLMDGERTERFGRVFRDAVYPSRLSRIPDRIREQIEDTGLKANCANLKADQWKAASNAAGSGFYRVGGR